ncbi:MAG TPA: response regulator [Nitrospira sp.]|nr:response regulator [Nitrospira sp.]
MSMKHNLPIRTVLVDGSPECLVRLEKWLGTLSNFAIVGKASSGVDALEQCRALRPDLVLMDVALPCMNGYEATARIKEDGHCPMIILMSLFHMDEAYEVDSYSKADVVLNKDVLYEELIPAVTRLFPGRAGVPEERSFEDNMV